MGNFFVRAQAVNDSALYYYQTVLDPAQPSDLPAGIQFYSEQKEIHLNNHDTLQAINALRMVAIGQYKLGNIFASENAAVAAIALMDALEHRDSLIDERLGLYNQLGNIYSELLDEKQALATYETALTIATEKEDSLILLNNKANVFKDAKAYTEAKKQLEFATTLFTDHTQPLTKALVLDNLGFVKFKLSEPDALPYLEEALQLRQAANDLSREYASHRSLFAYYLETNPEKANAHAAAAYQIAQQLHSGPYLKDALSQYLLLAGDERVASYKTVSDSLERLQKLADNKNAFLKYNVDKQRALTQAAEFKSAQEEQSKLYLLGLLLLLLVLGAVSFLLLRLRHKKEKMEEVFVTETAISKKIHDEVANDLYHVMVQLQQANGKEENTLTALDSIYQKTRNISKDLDALEVTENYSQTLGDLLESYKSEAVHVLTRHLYAVDWELYGTLEKKTLYRVLQELMTNMKKHSQASVVVLRFAQEGKKLRVAYSDDGVGALLHEKRGLQNTENRMRSIGGRITFETEPGKGFKAHLFI